MTYAIRYLSKTGNTKRIAEAIASELNVPAKSIVEEISEPTDILFLGGAVYAFGIDPTLKKFINNLDNNVKNVAIFSTSAIFNFAFKKMKKLLIRKNIRVFDNNFIVKVNIIKQTLVNQIATI